MNGMESNLLNSSAGREKGAALFLSLIFLFILTIIGLSGMKSSALQEKMAGNMKDRNLAFQAAESALKTGETIIRTNYAGIQGGFLCGSDNDGLYNAGSPGTAANCPASAGWPSNKPGDHPYQPFDDNFWTGNTDVLKLNAGGFGNLAEVPQFVMETLAAPVSSAGQSLEAGNPMPQGAPKYFRITARGVGITPGTVVIIQSVVRY